MATDEISWNEPMTKRRSREVRGHSGLVIDSTIDIGDAPIATAKQLAELLTLIDSIDRVAIDTEADSLHCYREKLCLLQLSVPDHDLVIDPLAQLDLKPLGAILQEKEIVLHGSDYDLRLLRRAFEFQPCRMFDTVIAARLLGIREFSLAALVKRYFGIELAKGSQKANWAQRPLSARMIEYAINDTHYLLPLAEKLEVELREANRFDWFCQSCDRAIEQAATDRVRDADEAWRITGSGTLRGRAAAVLRELWRWREREAEAADRPPFHILQNRELISAAQTFALGETADYRHFSARRRQQFREAAQRALLLPEEDWPAARKRFGSRPTREVINRTEQLREYRDAKAAELGLEPAFIAPRSTLEAIAAKESEALELLVPWQRGLLGLAKL